MDRPMTPQEACELGSKLWGKPLTLKRSPTQPGRTDVYGDDGAFRFEANFNIDWGDVDQWPPPIPEPVYETPNFPDDWGKECEFSDSRKHWHKYQLAGYCPGAVTDLPWVTHTGIRWAHCRIKRVPAQDKTPPEPSPVEASFPSREMYAKHENKRLQPVEPTDEDVERACDIYRCSHYHIYGTDGNAHREEARKWLRAWQQVVIDKARGDA